MHFKLTTPSAGAALTGHGCLSEQNRLKHHDHRRPGKGPRNSKLLRVMKLTAILVLVVLQASAISGNAQRVTLTEEEYSPAQPVQRDLQANRLQFYIQQRCDGKSETCNTRYPEHATG